MKTNHIPFTSIAMIITTLALHAPTQAHAAAGRRAAARQMNSSTYGAGKSDASFRAVQRRIADALGKSDTNLAIVILPNAWLRGKSAVAAGASRP